MRRRFLIGLDYSYVSIGRDWSRIRRERSEDFVVLFGWDR